MQDADDSRVEPPEASGEVEAFAAQIELAPKACVVMVSGKHPGRIIHLVPGENVIGRSPQAQIRVDDRAISGKHAKVIVRGETYQLVDLGSTNGTFLNGVRLPANQPAPLAYNDSIQIAETVLAFLPAHGTEQPSDQTQTLAHLSPQLPHSSALRLSDANAIAQLLQTSLLPQVEPPAPTLEEQLAKAMRVWAVVKRNGIYLLSAVAFCGLVGNATAFLFPPESEAEFTIRITPSITDESQRNDPKNQRFFTATEQNFTNASLIEKTLQTLPAAKRPPLPQAKGALKFDSVAHMTYEASYRYADPDVAVAFLSNHLRLFLESEIQRTLHVRQKEVDFLAGRLQTRGEELSQMEARLRDFKNKYLEGMPEYASGHINTRETLLSRRAELSAELSRATAEMNHARKRLKDAEPLASRRVTGASPYEQALGEAKRRLAEARARGLSATSPEVSSLENQIREYERLVAEARNKEVTELDRAADPELNAMKTALGQAEVEVKGSSAALGEVNAQLDRLEKIVSKMPEVEAEYAELSRSYSVSKEMHTKLFAQHRDSQLKLELERTSALARYEVLSPPASSGVPLRKALITRSAMGVALGLFFGVLIAAVIEFKRFLRSRLKPTVTVAKTGAIVPVRPPSGQGLPPA